MFFDLALRSLFYSEQEGQSPSCRSYILLRPSISSSSCLLVLDSKELDMVLGMVLDMVLGSMLLVGNMEDMGCSNHLDDRSSSLSTR